MGSPSLYSARKTTLALAVALSFAWQAPVFAHGGEAHMVPMDKTLKEFGADVQWDDYAQLFTLIKDGAYVKVKPGAQTAIVNGQPLALQVAGETGMSVRSLYRMFADKGLVVAQYIRNRRLDFCADAIRHAADDEKLAGIGFHWGFSDQSHFSTVFKQRFGMTPGEYRRKFR